MYKCLRKYTNVPHLRCSSQPSLFDEGRFWANNSEPVRGTLTRCAAAAGGGICADFGPKIATRNVVFGRSIIIINWIGAISNNGDR